MFNNMVKKFFASTIIFIIIVTSFMTNITGAIRNNIYVKDVKLSISNVNNIKTNFVNNETEFWSVVVSTRNNTFIYDSLINTSNWDETHIRLLHLENSTKKQILLSLDWLREMSDSNDIVLFSDSSHGTHINGEYGIVPWDGGIVTSYEIDEKLDMIESQGICLIFDCCLSGNMIDNNNAKCLDRHGQFIEFFSKGVGGDNRVVLMSTKRFGLGYSMNIGVNNKSLNISFSKFVADAINGNVDDNDDGFYSAEEIFYYAREKFLPWAILMLLFIRLQISIFLSAGYFIIAFPTLYDNYDNELPIVVK